MAQAYLSALKALPSYGPSVEVTYDNVSHEIRVPVADTGITNVAESVVNFATKPFRAALPSKPINILSGVSGRIRPGTSTLVIGNPGGGKTSFLRFLAGRDRPSTGSILWNGEAIGQPGCANPGKVAVTAPQVDVHEPLLTVRETFQFVADCCLARLPADAAPAQASLRAGLVDHVIDTLGLRECEAVIIGDELNRGVSGGQKKRVTLGEALLTGSRLLCLDEVTNGLDAATAADIVSFLVEWSHVTEGTIVAALQQVTPEIFRAFDNVVMLSNGHQLYHGPPAALSTYLASIGYVCPDYMDIADFCLTVCVSPAFAAEECRAEGEKGPAFDMMTREALGAAWSVYSAADEGMLADKFPLLKGGVQLLTAQEKAQFGVPMVHSSARHMALLVGRQSRLVFRNPAVSFGRIFQFIILGSIFGSIFWKIGVDNFVVKFSLAIYAASAVSFASFAEIPTIFVSKRAAARHMEAGFFQPFAYVLSIIVNALPAGILSTFLFATILYWMTGFADDAGRYFFFVLALVCHEMCISALFRLFAFALPREELAQAAAGITTGTCLVFGGFYIPYDKIPPFMWPIFYLSPFSWTVRSMVNSEFTAKEYNDAIAPPFVMDKKGDVYLDSFSFAKGMDWKWAGIGYCIALFLFFGPIVSPLVVSYIKVREDPGSQRISDASFLAAAAAAKTAIGKSTSAKVSPPTSNSDLPALANNDGTFNMANPSLVVVKTSMGPVSASSALPFTPATLSFIDVTYAVTLPDKSSKPLLRGISGYARPGTMTALMGASGAGKTTLLDVLAFRKTTGAVGGAIRVNGASVTPDVFSRFAGFAEQEDVHADYATVKEAIEFSASLRLQSSVTAAQRTAFVAEVLAILELQPLAGRRTGNLSQGEKKRLTIGVELAANPAILFLDEPTTGLDARSAAAVMRVIRNIATTGRTVVATIHQPSAEVFFAFDNLLCLIPGGYETYLGALHGPHKRAENLVAFLEAVEGVASLPHGTNPATWMLEQMSAIGSNEGVSLPSLYATSELTKTNAVVLNTMCTVSESSPLTMGAKPGFLTQLHALFARQMLYMWRNTLWNGLRLFVFIFLSLFFGLLYLRIDDSDQAGVFGKIAVALNAMLFVSIINLNTGIPNYARLRAVYYREKAAGYYNGLAYPLSLIFTELPWTMLFSLVFLSINYFLVAFTSDAGDFFTAYLATLLVPWWFAIIGMGFIAFFPFPLLANIFGGLTIQLSILFAGVQLSVNELPSGWKWLYYCDGFAHALRLFMLPQYEGDKTLITVFSSGRPTLVPREDFVVYRLGTEAEHKWDALGWLLLIVGGAASLATLFYVKVNHQKR